MVAIHDSPSTRVLFGVSDLVSPLPITYLMPIVSSFSYSIFKVQRDMSSLRSSEPSRCSGPSFSPAFHRLDHFARLVTSPRLSSSTASIPLYNLWSLLLARRRKGIMLTSLCRLHLPLHPNRCSSDGLGCPSSNSHRRL